MPTLVVGVVVVDVPPPCCKSMISFPHEEYLPTEMCKIRILIQLNIELHGVLLSERALWGHNGRETERSMGMSLKTETYITRYPSRYLITNSHSKRCTSTSLIGRTRGRAHKRHKGMEKWDLLVGLIWRRWITPLESSFCDLRSSSSHTTSSVSEMAKTVFWPIATALQKHKQEKTSLEC